MPKNTLPLLKILQWNVRSLYRAKLESFKDNRRKTNPSVVFLCETHWVDSHPVSFKSYNCFFLNRAVSNGGGVAILIKKCFAASPLLLPPCVNMECIGVRISLPDDTSLDLVSVYCPKGNAVLSDFVTLFGSLKNKFIVCGDFNAHHPLWEDSHPPNRCGSAISDFLCSNPNVCLCTPHNLVTRICPSTRKQSTIGGVQAKTTNRGRGHLSDFYENW